jgi:hypothetical protein
MQAQWKLASAVALAACVLLSPPAAAQTARQRAGSCDVYTPVFEDPTLKWDYWWSGRCVGGLASGPGFLVEYMKSGGFGDVYEMSTRDGHVQGEVYAYGPAFLGSEWNIRAGTAKEGEEWPEAWRSVDANVSRFSLPAALQEVLNRFAREVGHRQMPSLPVASGGERCRPSIEVETRPGGPRQKLDVAGFIRSHAGYEAARREALLQAMAAQDRSEASEEQRLLARSRLALATAVVGCR